MTWYSRRALASLRLPSASSPPLVSIQSQTSAATNYANVAGVFFIEPESIQVR